MPTASPNNSEWLTRKTLIDARLRKAGWRVVPYAAGTPLAKFDRCAIEEYPTKSGPADYALCVAGQILGIVEAKKLTLGPQNVLSQAERYSRGLVESPFHFGDFRVPFLYSTNGEVIWHHDVRHPLNRSRQIAQFHTPDALREFLGRDLEAAYEKVRLTPNDHPHIRPYQRDANAATEDAIVKRKRQMLLAMATGTGKTFTMVNQIYRLMEAGVAKRVLFLVDRRILAAQAVRAFASFEAKPGLKFDKIYEVYSQRFRREDLGEEEKFDPKVLPASYLLEPSARQAFVYVSTIQRMTINLLGRDAVFGIGDEEIDEDAEKIGEIPIQAFDLVIADECHRGYTSSELAIWRQTIEHFDAVKIGLNASQYGRFGYRRITALLKLAGWNVGKDRVQRIWRREGLKVPAKQKPRGRLWLNDGSCIRLRPEHRNHVWSYDFVEARTHDGRSLRLLVMMDEFTRECLAIRVARRLNSAHVIELLGDCMLAYGVPDHVRSDNGAEMTARRVKQWLASVGTKPLFIEPGSPWENGYCESFNGKLRDECLNGEIFYSLKEARVVIEQWRKFYNTVRPHSSLGYRAPAPVTWIAAA